MIAKEPSANEIGKFRPIALENFKYKTISEIITWLVKITDKLISSQQRGFMQGRSILDCTETVSVAINLLDRKCSAGDIANNIDIKRPLLERLIPNLFFIMFNMVLKPLLEPILLFVRHIVPPTIKLSINI